MTKVLLVVDSAEFVERVAADFSKEGYSLDVAINNEEALRKFSQIDYGFILLCVSDPEIPGIDICKEIRKTSSVPLIMLACESEELDIVVGLEVGADDYLSKPIKVKELLARMRAVSRRDKCSGQRTEADSNTIEVGELKVDIDKHEIILSGKKIEMPLKEFELLIILMSTAGKVVTRSILIDKIWGSDYYGDSKTLDVHMKRLREKIEVDSSKPKRIVTIRGLGYRFEL